MSVKVIIISEEDYKKLPEGLSILHEETHDSIDEYQIARTLEDIHINIGNLEDITSEERQFLIDDAYELAVKFLKAHSFSSYNDHITEILMEAVTELREDAITSEDRQELVKNLLAETSTEVVDGQTSATFMKSQGINVSTEEI